MNTKHLMKKLPSCLLGAILAAGIASTTMVNAVDGNPPGLFELEGNPEGEGTPGDDWEVLYNFGGNDGGSPFAFTGIVHDVSATDRVFFQGGSKDIYDVDKWKYSEGSTPDKNEITNAYAAAYNNPTDVCVTAGVAGDCAEGQTPVHEAGDLIVYFGLDRFANDGDALAGFWFFQGEVSLSEPSNQDTGDFIGNHVAMRDNPDFGLPGEPEFLPGDMFIIVNYPQGANAEPEIKVYQWDPNDVDGDVNFDPSEQTKPPKNLSSPLDLVFTDAQALCDGAGDKLACAITNPADIENSPEWEYTPKSGLATTLPHESLFEGGINVTALLGTTPCFASFLAETRSSTSQTAQLKDFVFGAFPVCGIEVVKDCEANLNDDGTGVDVTFSGTVENTGGSSYIAYVKDDQAGSTIDKVCIDTNAPGCADDADISTKLNGGAHFPLGGNGIVRYEGSYSVAGLPPIPPVTDPPTFALNDEVTAEAYADAEDIGNPQLVIIADSDTAGCDYQFRAELGITKTCDLILGAGAASASVTITGTVTNTGNVPLENLTLVDSDFGPLTLTGVLGDVAGDGVGYLAAGDSEQFTATQSVAYSALDPTPSGPVDGVTTVQLTHRDTIEVEGEVLDSEGTLIGGDDAVSDEASCGATLTNGILVEKDCDVALDFSDVTGRIVVRVDVTATVTNLGSENLTGLVLTDDPLLDAAFKVNDAAVPTTLDAGDSFTATGSYFPDTTIGGTNPNPGSASFTDTVDVTANGAFSALSATDENTAVCDLCPPVDAH